MPDGDHDENEVEIITNIQVTKSVSDLLDSGSQLYWLRSFVLQLGGSTTKEQNIKYRFYSTVKMNL